MKMPPARGGIFLCALKYFKIQRTDVTPAKGFVVAHGMVGTGVRIFKFSLFDFLFYVCIM